MSTKAIGKRKVSLKAIYAFLTILVFIGSALSSTTIILGLGILSVTFVYFNTKYINKKNSIFIPAMTVVLLLFQNFSIGIGAHLTLNYNERLSLLTQIPTMFIAISYAFVMVNKKTNKVDFVYLFYVLLCIVQLFRTDTALMTKIPYLRNFIIFYMGFVIGRYYLNTEEKINRFTSFFLRISIVAALFGLLGVLLGKDFYTQIGTLEVYAAKKYTTYKNGLPGNFVTVFAGKRVNRLASLYYDPVNFSYFMALSVLVAWITKRRWLTIFLAICEILTFGKGGLLILLLSGVCVVVQKLMKRITARVIKVFIMISVVAGLVALVIIIQKYYSDDFGTANHFYGIITGIAGIAENPWGYGIGSAGNLLKTGQRLLSEMNVSETGLINMVYQIGVFPSVLFIILLCGTSSGTLENYRKTGNAQYLLFTYIPFVLLLISIFQENTFTPQCIIPYMVFQGSFSNSACRLNSGELVVKLE